jgi:hypothetical protein
MPKMDNFVRSAPFDAPVKRLSPKTWREIRTRNRMLPGNHPHIRENLRRRSRNV